MSHATRAAYLCFHAIGAFLILGLTALAREPDLPAASRLAGAQSQAADRAIEPAAPARESKRRATAHHQYRRNDQKDVARAAGSAVKKRHRAKLDEVNTWLIFGFTEGADVGQKGEWTIFKDSVIRASRRVAGFTAWDGSAGIGYSVTDRAVISLAAAPSFERNADQASSVYGTTLTNARGFGAIAGFKYQLLRRDQSPAGLAFQVSPYWQRIATGPDGHDTFGTEFRLIADRALVPERWFAAVNLAYQPYLDAYADGSLLRKAAFEISGAVSRRLWGDLFVGGEVRHVSKFQGYFIDQPAGHALYFGPTLFTSIGEHGYFGIAWSAQVAGHARISTAAGPAPENLDRHQVRLKAGISF